MEGAKEGALRITLLACAPDSVPEEKGGNAVTAPACPCCSVVVAYKDIQPDGMYVFGDQSLASWRCKCGTNRAARFSDIPPELRRAAMLADLSNQPDNETTLAPR